jgi:hypothetical protein
MDEFYLTPFDDVDNPKSDFYLLYKNDRNFFIEFIESLRQKSDIEELNSIRALMDIIDNNLPKTKFNHITGGSRNKNRKDVYEFKSKHLRVYVIKKSPDFYIILGGYKKGQKKDIEKIFRHFNDIPDDIEIIEKE